MPQQLWKTPGAQQFDPLVTDVNAQQMQQSADQNIMQPMQRRARAAADAATPKKNAAFYGDK